MDLNYKEIGENTNGPAATLFIYNPYRRYEVWRFVTYMFVHVGVMHIMMNLIIQIFLGIALELVHHWWRVALVYLAGKFSIDFYELRPLEGRQSPVTSNTSTSWLLSTIGVAAGSMGTSK